MDQNDLLGLSATFDRVALAIERDGLDAHSLERVMAWGCVTFGRQLTRREGGIEEPFVTVKVRNWAHRTVIDRDRSTVQLLAFVLRELSYDSKRERLGFSKERTEVAFEVAENPEKYTDRIVNGAVATLSAVVRYSRDEEERDAARPLVRKLIDLLGDQT